MPGQHQFHGHSSHARETRPKRLHNTRVSTEAQDLSAQRDALATLGVESERVYVDHGFTGTNKNRAGLREALAACRAGDTFVVTRLDRSARSVRDAHEIADNLTSREINLSISGSP